MSEEGTGLGFAAVWEDHEVRLARDYDVTGSHTAGYTCPHVVNGKLPRVVIAYNEGGSNNVGICADCLLAALAETSLAETRAPWAAIRYVGGDVDDVAIDGDLFRLERMSPDQWWLCIYRGEQSTRFWLYWDRKAKTIKAVVTEDTIGCTDDSKAGKEVDSGSDVLGH